MFVVYIYVNEMRVVNTVNATGLLRSAWRVFVRCIKCMDIVYMMISARIMHMLYECTRART